jgi:hypothetical protein
VFLEGDQLARDTDQFKQQAQKIAVIVGLPSGAHEHFLRGVFDPGHIVAEITKNPRRRPRRS